MGLRETRKGAGHMTDIRMKRGTSWDFLPELDDRNPGEVK